LLLRNRNDRLKLEPRRFDFGVDGWSDVNGTSEWLSRLGPKRSRFGLAEGSDTEKTTVGLECVVGEDVEVDGEE